MITYVLERCITNDDNWELYSSLSGCDESAAIEQWRYWQSKQPNYQFRVYRVTRELITMRDITKGVNDDS